MQTAGGIVAVVGVVMLLGGVFTSGEQKTSLSTSGGVRRTAVPSSSTAGHALGKAVLEQIRSGQTDSKIIAKNIAADEGQTLKMMTRLLEKGYITKDFRVTAKGFDLLNES